MAKILVNYIHHKKSDTYEILASKYVYYDMAVAVLDTEDDVDIPIVVPINGVNTIVDKNRYEENHKKFKLSSDPDGKVFEHEMGAEIWLPKDTDISKLRVVNGRLVKVEEEPEKEQNAQPPKKRISKKEA